MAQLVRTVQRVVDAPAQEIFELLARPSRHGEFDGSGTVQGATSGPDRLELGSRFGVSMNRGVSYTSSNQVVEFDEGRRIAWRTGAFRGEKLLFGGQVWRYELVERGDGTTLVKESFDLSGARPARLLDRFAGPSTLRNMQATLDRLAERFQR